MGGLSLSDGLGEGESLGYRVELRETVRTCFDCILEALSVFGATMLN